MKLYHLHFKSESCDTYDLYFYADKEPTKDELLQYVFVKHELDGGEEEWGRKYNEIPYCELDLNLVLNFGEDTLEKFEL